MGSPPRVATVASRLALPLVAELRRRGVSPSPMLGAHGLTEAGLRDLASRIPLDAWLAIRASCAGATADEGFALVAATNLERSAIPLEMHLVSSQESVRAGLAVGLPFVDGLIDGLTLDVALEDDRSRADFRRIDAPLGPPAFAEYLLALLVAFVRVIAPSSRPPSAVRFAHAEPTYGAAVRAAFDCPVRFGARAVGFDFDAPSLDVAIPTADPELGALLATRAVDSRIRATTALRLRDRARGWLAANLGNDVALAHELAFAMRVSERTLRRRLSEEGTSVRSLIDEIRRDRAETMLADAARSLDEIAAELGFSGANAFGRAFRGWTGVPPLEFRRSRGAQRES